MNNRIDGSDTPARGNTGSGGTSDNMLDKRKVLIVGARQFNSALISFFLEKEGGADCTLVSDFNEAEDHFEGGLSFFDVVLWDVHRLDVKEISETLESDQQIRDNRVAMFEVVRDQQVENMALKSGIKGFFYVGDPLELFLKGMYYICKGELWVSRKVMETVLLDSYQQPDQPKVKEKSLLTHREREILAMILQGAHNAEIADTLCISLHTVKAHIYNTFKKIKVSNRLQAARWAAEHLEEA